MALTGNRRDTMAFRTYLIESYDDEGNTMINETRHNREDAIEYLEDNLDYGCMGTVTEIVQYGAFDSLDEIIHEIN
jgi:hypothetical protein